MDETEEVLISTETERLPNFRYTGLVIFLVLTLIIVIASLLVAFLRA